MRLLILFCCYSFAVYSQSNVLVLGNHSPLCIQDNIEFNKSDTLPDSLNKYGVILLFSGSTSSLSESDIERIVEFVELGGGLYSGAENWPLQAESNQLTNRLYKKESFGHYDENEAETVPSAGNLQLDLLEQVPTGSSTVAFPMDYRLKVEAWVDDQPLILSGNIEKGRIIIDGGYSRFYCNQRTELSDQLLRLFLNFLLKI